MGKSTRFGYGFCFIGVAVPYIIQYLFGQKWALAFSFLCLFVGIGFLISAHLHTDDEMAIASTKPKPDHYRVSVISNVRTVVGMAGVWVLALLAASPHVRRVVEGLAQRLHVLWN